MSEFIEYPQAMDSFIIIKSSAEESEKGKPRRSQTYYQRFMKLLLRGAKRSLVHVARELVAKCHIYELLTSLQVDIDSYYVQHSQYPTPRSLYIYLNFVSSIGNVH